MYLTPSRIEPTREAVRQIRPDDGLRLGWDDVEQYVMPSEWEAWEHFKRITPSPFDAIRKLKGLA